MTTTTQPRSPFPAAPTVYSYVRFSTPEQRKGTGQARQDALADDWCKAKGLTLERNYSDLGVSAFKGKNATEGALSKFLELVQAGKIRRGSVLLVESLDRLSRQNLTQALPVFLQIINAGVTVATLCDGAEYSAEKCEMPQLMMSLMIFARANDESKMKSQRKAASWKAKREGAKQGKTLGGKTPAWIGVADGRYVVKKDEADKVRAIFRDYTEGGMGIYTLNKKYGIPKATLAYWLNNPVVLGSIRITEDGHAVDVPNHYPPIVDRGTWELAQRKKAERYIVRRSGREGWVNLFAGLLVDPKGQRMDIARHYGFASYLSASCGFCLQARYLEIVLCCEVLPQKFMTTSYVETTGVSTEAAEIEKKIGDVQREMLDGGDVVAALVPVLRELKRRHKTAMAETTQTVTKQVSDGLIRSLLMGENDTVSRRKTREIVRDTIRQVGITEYTSNGSNGATLVRGTVELNSGETVPFGYAYCPRRVGYAMTDTLTDEVRQQLLKFPTRKENGDLGFL